MIRLSAYLLTLLIFIGFITSCTTTEQMVQTPPEVVVERIFERDAFPVERYERAQALLNRNLWNKVFNSNVNVTWVDERAFYYSVNTRNGFELFFVNVDIQTKEPLFDQELVATGLGEVIGEEDAPDPYRLQVNDMEVSSDYSTVHFVWSDKKWAVNRATSSVSVVEELERIERPRASVLSPYGSLAAFIQDHNLYVRDMKTGDDTQLTVDGSEFYGYATDSQGWSRSERPILYWSADGALISTYQLDEREVEKMHLLRTASPRPELVSWPYALPGDEHVPMHKRVIIDVRTGAITRLDTTPYHQRTSNCCGLTRGSYWADNQFSDDGRYLAYVATSRDYKEVTLKVADVATGSVQEVHFERDDIFIETNLTSRGTPNWKVLFDSNEFIWFSRKDNWGHLYLHDLVTGEKINQITTGEWNVIDIIHVDETQRRIYFSAVGMDDERDPYQMYYFSIMFDGSGLRSYTPDEGHHSATFSPDFNHLVSTVSDFTTPPVTLVKNRFGEILLQIEEADITDLLDAGWTKPLPFKAKARDGVTDIYGTIYKPSDFNPEKSYPIINNIYPGPQIGSVGTRAFSPARRGQTHALAELGFIVVQIDALGTPYRSREFHTAYYGDMSDNGLPDQVAAMKQLAGQYSWIDINRAGMYGHSGGGFATAAALFNFPEFFKVGVSSAGNLDNRGYTFYWGEKFQGPLVELEDGEDSFTNQALQYQVENLSGHLLLSYGTMDSNVHPNMTHLVIDALIDANKDFDLMVMPNRGHGYANESYKVRRTWDYFVKHLLGMEPPKEFDL